MNEHYFLYEINRANEYIVDTYNIFNVFGLTHNLEYFNRCMDNIMEVNRILERVKRELNLKLEEKKHEQLQ